MFIFSIPIPSFKLFAFWLPASLILITLQLQLQLVAYHKQSLPRRCSSDASWSGKVESSLQTVAWGVCVMDEGVLKTSLCMPGSGNGSWSGS